MTNTTQNVVPRCSVDGHRADQKPRITSKNTKKTQNMANGQLIEPVLETKTTINFALNNADAV